MIDTDLISDPDALVTAMENEHDPVRYHELEQMEDALLIALVTIERAKDRSRNA